MSAKDSASRSRPLGRGGPTTAAANPSRYHYFRHAPKYLRYSALAFCGACPQKTPLRVPGRLAGAGRLPQRLTRLDIITSDTHRNTCGIRRSPFAAHVRKRLRFAFPAAWPGRADYRSG